MGERVGDAEVLRYTWIPQSAFQPLSGVSGTSSRFSNCAPSLSKVDYGGYASRRESGAGDVTPAVTRLSHDARVIRPHPLSRSDMSKRITLLQGREVCIGLSIVRVAKVAIYIQETG